MPRSHPSNHLRKTIKVGCLAVLNGGAVASKTIIGKTLKDKYGDEGNPLSLVLNDICQGLRALPLSRELQLVVKETHVDKVSYLMSRPHPYIATEKFYTTVSHVLASGEVTGLSFFVDFLAESQFPLVPLSLEHDSIVVGTTSPTSGVRGS